MANLAMARPAKLAELRFLNISKKILFFIFECIGTDRTYVAIIIYFLVMSYVYNLIESMSLSEFSTIIYNIMFKVKTTISRVYTN